MIIQMLSHRLRRLFSWQNKSSYQETPILEDEQQPELESDYVLGPLVIPDGLRVGMDIVLQTHNCPNFYVAYNPSNSNINIEENFFDSLRLRVVKGLKKNSNINNWISFQTIDYPNYYLIDNGAQMRLVEYKESQLFYDLSTFECVPGLANPQWMSFKSIAKADAYIRHIDYILKVTELDKGNPLVNKQDSTFLPIVAFGKRKLNIILRGHIRNGFKDDQLYFFLQNLYKQFDLAIYIHTWSIYQNTLSWRSLSEDTTMVNEEVLKNYLRDLYPLVKHIMIENDQNISLIGKLDGFVGDTPCPTKGFKNMLYGQLKAAEYVYNNVDHQEQVLQMRLDAFGHKLAFKPEQIIKLIKHPPIPQDRIKFVSAHPVVGIDNVYMSSVENMYQFLLWFYNNFDVLNAKYSNLKNQEFIAFFERNSF